MQAVVPEGGEVFACAGMGVGVDEESRPGRRSRKKRARLNLLPAKGSRFTAGGRFKGCGIP